MTSPKMIAAVVHEVIAAQRFTSWADLAETVKARCARLRLPYDSGTLTEAVRLVERTRPVFAPPARPANPRHVERLDAVRPLSRAEAADLCARLGVALGRAPRRSAGAA